MKTQCGKHHVYTHHGYPGQFIVTQKSKTNILKDTSRPRQPQRLKTGPIEVGDTVMIDPELQHASLGWGPMEYAREERGTVVLITEFSARVHFPSHNSWSGAHHEFVHAHGTCDPLRTPVTMSDTLGGAHRITKRSPWSMWEHTLAYDTVQELQPIKLTTKDKLYLDTTMFVEWCQLCEGLYNEYTDAYFTCEEKPETPAELLRVMKEDSAKDWSTLVRPNTPTWDNYLGQFPANIILRVST